MFGIVLAVLRPVGLRIASLLAIVLCTCAGESNDAPDGPWSNTDKCVQVCASYCSVRQSCDGTPPDVCRMSLDEADGGTCSERAALFDEVTQPQVELCIAAIEDMSCPDFEHMFNTGEGVPAECDGIID